MHSTNSSPVEPQLCVPTPVDSGGKQTLDMLLSRSSARSLKDPAPSPAELNLILDAAMRAPDHGNLHPARFLIVRGQSRQVLGEILAERLMARDPAASAAVCERYRMAPLSAPLLIGIVAHLALEHPVPEIEQILSVGASTMNILNALHALGYGGLWVTGASCYDPLVSKALGLAEEEKLLGLLYVGTPAEEMRQRRRHAGATYAIEWQRP